MKSVSIGIAALLVSTVVWADGNTAKPYLLKANKCIAQQKVTCAVEALDSAADELPELSALIGRVQSSLEQRNFTRAVKLNNQLLGSLIGKVKVETQIQYVDRVVTDNSAALQVKATVRNFLSTANARYWSLDWQAECMKFLPANLAPNSIYYLADMTAYLAWQDKTKRCILQYESDTNDVLVNLYDIVK